MLMMSARMEAKALSSAFWKEEMKVAELTILLTEAAREECEMRKEMRAAGMFMDDDD